MTGWLFAAAGLAAGVTEVGLLARTARRAADPVSVLLRLAVVGAVLILAARAGHLAQGAMGWILGFVSAGTVVYRRLG